MVLYAQRRSLKSLQITSDIAIGLWLIASVYLASLTYDFINKLSQVGRWLQDGGSSVNGIPMIGKALAPIGHSLGSAGSSQVSFAAQLAMACALIVGAVLILPVLSWYITLRWRWMRFASAVMSLHDSPGFKQLMAQRALLRQPLHKLASVSDDPIGDFREGRYEALAALEIGRAGLALRHTRR